jgi:hypothetical protein
MRSTEELIEVINQYEADGILFELGEEVILLAKTLIDSGNLTDALKLMEVYTEEAEWPNYGADGYWAEHTQVVDILLNLGMNYEGVDAGSILFDWSEEENFPIYFRIGATINPRLQGGEVESVLEKLTNGEPCDSFDWEEQFIAVGLFFNQNLTDEVFVKYFQLMDSETLEYMLSIGKSEVNSWGWDFQYVQEFLAGASNSKSGQMRILDFVANIKDDFITPRIQFSDLRWESKEKYIAGGS